MPWAQGMEPRMAGGCPAGHAPGRGVPVGRGVQSPAPGKYPRLSPHSPCKSGPSHSQALWPRSDCLSHPGPPQEGLHPVLSAQALPCLARLSEQLNDSTRKNGVLGQPHIPTLLQTQGNLRVGAATPRGWGRSHGSPVMGGGCQEGNCPGRNHKRAEPAPPELWAVLWAPRE